MTLAKALWGGSGATAGSWAAIVCMLILVAFGVALADGILCGGNGLQSENIIRRLSTLAAGGWSPKSAGVLTGCYQFPDNETMLAVMSEPRKVSERATGT
jgi:hypothetical protein